MRQAIWEVLEREFPGLEGMEEWWQWRTQRCRGDLRVRGWAWAAPGLCLRFEALMGQEAGQWHVKQLNLRIGPHGE